MSWLVPALGGGVAFGLAVQYGDHALGSFRAAVWIGAPWLLVAFAAGALVRRGRRVAAATGAGVLTSATAAYYLVLAAHGSLLYAAAMTVAWGAVAALVGAGCAVAGATWRSGRGPGAAIAGAVPGAAATAEGILLLGVWRGAGATLVLLAETAVGLTLTAGHVRSSTRIGLAVAAAAVLVVAFMLGEHQLRAGLRAAGWAGP
jgi:hypothetical protein